MCIDLLGVLIHIFTEEIMGIENQIKRISAKGMVGLYDYDINFQNGDSKLKAIFSENGCGKTNLLKLIHYVTSGNIEKLQKVPLMPFRELCIKTSMGTILFEKNENRSVILSIRDNNEEELLSEELRAGDLNSASDVELSDEIQDRYIRMSFNIHEYTGKSVLLGTNRLNDTDARTRYRVRMLRKHEAREETDRDYEVSGNIIYSVLDDLNYSLVRNAQIASTTSRGSRGVYSKIVKYVLNDRAGLDQRGRDVRNEIIKKIKHINNIKKLVDKYNLIDFKEFRSIEKEIEAPRSTVREFKSLYSILIPYFDSLEEKIQDVLPAASLIESFINAINTMFRDKVITYNIQGAYGSRNGFTVQSIVAHKNEESLKEIDPADLSSGEKHLIFLLAKVIISATRGDTLLIIDEPEISLGMMWQRLFVKYVRKCAAESGLQIIMATHSPLILDKYEEIDVSMSKREIRSHM